MPATWLDDPEHWWGSQGRNAGDSRATHRRLRSHGGKGPRESRPRARAGLGAPLSCCSDLDMCPGIMVPRYMGAHVQIRFDSERRPSALVRPVITRFLSSAPTARPSSCRHLLRPGSSSACRWLHKAAAAPYPRSKSRRCRPSPTPPRCGAR